tara:strand:- start:79728 stop:79952 length:225 start_codon:yes stop_codon:yes gene_type:complete
LGHTLTGHVGSNSFVVNGLIPALEVVVVADVKPDIKEAIGEGAARKGVPGSHLDPKTRVVSKKLVILGAYEVGA